MICHHARWVLPIAQPPIADGWVAVEAGRVIGVGHGWGPDGGEHRHLGDAAILPGLVNAHTHLELSYLGGVVPPSDDFVTWIRAVVAARRQQPDAQSDEIASGLAAGISQATRTGTAVVGDISNTLITVDALMRSPLAGVVFYELIRFNAPDPDGFLGEAAQRLASLTTTSRVRASFAAHAPYSVSPHVFKAMRRVLDRDRRARCSVHLSESRAESEFIEHGTGDWRSFLQDVGAWDPSWRPAGVSPVRYLDNIGFLDSRVIAVHGVQMSGDDLAILAGCGATLVTCPRSNRLTGAGVPPVARFYESGVRVAVGTDSLASTPDLNVFAELVELRRLAPSVPAAALLASATAEGARALGFDGEYGTLTPGACARLLCVATDGPVDDVEEYLVSGVEPDQVTWLEA